MSTHSSFGSVRKLPSGRFQVRYFHLGKRIAADATFPTKADAKVFLAGVETDLKRGNYVDPQAGRITFGEYANWWLEQRPLRPHTRFGELSGLTLRHVDFDRSELRVSQTLYFKKGSGATLGPPKTESAHRTVAVPTQITQRLTDHIETFISDRGPNDLVFTSVKGSPLLNRTFAPYWHRALAGTNLTDIRFHDLRHLAGTEAATAGASLREVMSRMGHASSAASLPQGFRDTRQRHFKCNSAPNALLRCSITGRGQPVGCRSAGQIAVMSSPNAAAVRRRGWRASTPSSSWPRRRFWMKA